MKHYYFISDSHSRSFAYNPTFIPLFIGPGKTNLFLSEERYKETRRKVLDVISILDKNTPIIISLNEPNLRIYLEGKELYCNDDNSFINTIIERYVSLLLEINSSGVELITTTTIPREDSSYTNLARLYDKILKIRLADEGIKIIDFSALIANENGTIKKEYKADFIHANFKLGDMVALQLEGKESKKFSWEYKYDFSFRKNSTDYTFYIWGDFLKEDLVYRNSEPRDWSKYHYFTKTTDYLIENIHFLMKRGLEVQSAFVLNVKEGYIPLKLQPMGIQCYCYEYSKIARSLFEKVNFFNRPIIYGELREQYDICIIVKPSNHDMVSNCCVRSKCCFVIIANEDVDTFCSGLEELKARKIRVNSLFSILLLEGDRAKVIGGDAIYFYMVMYMYYTKFECYLKKLSHFFKYLLIQTKRKL